MAIGIDGFDRAVALPPGLTVSHIRNAIDYIEERAEELIDLYYEQAAPGIVLKRGRPTLANGAEAAS